MGSSLKLLLAKSERGTQDYRPHWCTKQCIVYYPTVQLIQILQPPIYSLKWGTNFSLGRGYPIHLLCYFEIQIRFPWFFIECIWIHLFSKRSTSMKYTRDHTISKANDDNIYAWIIFFHSWVSHSIAILFLACLWWLSVRFMSIWTIISQA